jgi:4a-hydroxytetrahydrobiopterin dehydratase
MMKTMSESQQAKLPQTKQDQSYFVPMTLAQMRHALLEVPHWEIENHGTVLKRTFQGNNFTGALILANKIGVLCDHEGHCPEMTVGQNYCKVIFQSHEVGGLQENDFIMAFKINQLLDKLRKATKTYHVDQFGLIS